jgi:hypothetical protein
MLKSLAVFSIIILAAQGNCQFNLTPLSPLPEKLSNGAIESSVINGETYIYVWGSLDSTRNSSGIHRRGYKLNLNTNVWSSLPQLPDTSGKLALSASRIGNIIYIIGGYEVFPNGNEVSSNKVHRFSIASEEFLSDGEPIPIAIDDQVQIEYKDSLIYVITGWSNTGNVGNVQVYSPESNSWSEGTDLPLSGGFRTFGSSGCVIEDTIYYFGGAVSNAANFPASNRLCKGYISVDNPLEIIWESSIPNPLIRRYRSACIEVNSTPFWVGGSAISYNYDGIAYNGSGPVPPVGNILSFNSQGLQEFPLDGLPMDIRDIAKINDSNWIIAGGLVAGPETSDMVWLLNYDGPSSINSINSQFKIYPNPSNGNIEIKLEKPAKQLEILDSNLNIIKQIQGNAKLSSALKIEASGFYWIKVLYQDGSIRFEKLIIQE